MQPAVAEKHQQQVADYATALNSLGKATGQLERIECELPTVLDLFEEHEQLRCFLARNDVQLDGKVRAVETILAKKLAPPLVYLLLTMLRNGDISLLPAVQHAFDQGLSETRERISGDVESAVPLSDERLAQLEREVGRIMGKQIRLHARVSPSILGGLLVRVGDVVIDGTLDTQLASLQKQLLS